MNEAIKTINKMKVGEEITTEEIREKITNNSKKISNETLNYLINKLNQTFWDYDSEILSDQDCNILCSLLCELKKYRGQKND